MGARSGSATNDSLSGKVRLGAVSPAVTALLPGIMMALRDRHSPGRDRYRSNSRLRAGTPDQALAAAAAKRSAAQARAADVRP